MSQRRQRADSPDEHRGESTHSVAQQRERSTAIEQLLISGVSRSRIEGLMRERYEMSSGAVRGVIERVRRRWAEEERESRLHYKEMAMRRLYGHIAEARKAANWPAVAQLERLLAEMQGTREPMVVEVNASALLTESAAHVLSQMTPERRGALIAQQRELRALAASAAATRPVVETTAEPVEPKP